MSYWQLIKDFFTKPKEFIYIYLLLPVLIPAAILVGVGFLGVVLFIISLLIFASPGILFFWIIDKLQEYKESHYDSR